MINIVCKLFINICLPYMKNSLRSISSLPDLPVFSYPTELLVPVVWSHYLVYQIYKYNCYHIHEHTLWCHHQSFHHYFHHKVIVQFCWYIWLFWFILDPFSIRRFSQVSFFPAPEKLSGHERPWQSQLL
jgi:hypothetical protein